MTMDSFTLLLDPESLLLDPEPGVRHTMARLAAELELDAEVAYQRPFDRAADLRTVLGEWLDLAPASHHLDLALARYRELYVSEGRYHGRLRPEMVAWLADLADVPGLTRLYLSHLGPAATLQLMETYEFHGVVDRLFVTATMLEPGQRACLLRGLLAGHGQPEAVAAGNARFPAHPSLAPSRLLLLSDMPHELLLARTLGIAALPLGFARCDPALFPDVAVALDVCDVARWVRARLQRWPAAEALSATAAGNAVGAYRAIPCHA